MVYAYSSIKNCNRIMSKIVVFDVICCQHYALWAGNGIKLFLTLQASIFVIAHHIDLGFFLCK